MEAQAHARSLYRSILRELPARPRAEPSSPLRNSIRKHFAGNPASSSQEYGLARRQELEQMVQYLKAQRMYGALLERYNPGANMNEEERVRLTARRVGMEMPAEWYGTGTKGKWGVKFEGGTGGLGIVNGKGSDGKGGENKS